MAKQSSSGETTSFVSGLIAGFILSAPLAMWLAPRSGAATRQTIVQQGLVIRRQVEQTVRRPVEQAQRQWEELRGDSVASALAEGRSIAAQQRAFQGGDAQGGAARQS